MAVLYHREDRSHFVPDSVLSASDGSDQNDKAEYFQKVHPAVTAIVTALRTTNASKIAEAYASHQPEILKWIVKQDMIDLPTDSYLTRSGLLDQDRRKRCHDSRQIRNLET